MASIAMLNNQRLYGIWFYKSSIDGPLQFFRGFLRIFTASNPHLGAGRRLVIRAMELVNWWVITGNTLGFNQLKKLAN